MKNLIVIIACVCFSAAVSFAQPGCNNLIEEATDFYNSGRYDDCIRTLENGLKKCSLSKSKKEKAYILLINANIEKDSMPTVDKYFKLLLLNNPAFKIKDYDGIDDFKGNFENYYVLPRLSIGARLYYYFPTINVDSGYSVMPDLEPKSEYGTEGRLKINFAFNYRVTKNIEQFSEIGYFSVSYDDSLNNSYWKVKMREKLSYIQWDIGTKYYFNTYNRFNIYIVGGVSNHFLTSAKLSLTTIENRPDNLYTNVENYDEKLKTLDNFNTRDQRNPYVPYLILGSGFMYKFGNFAYGVDFRFYQHLRYLNNPQERLNDKLIKEYSYMDNNFSLFRLDVSLSAIYMFNKVKSKKLRQD